MDRFLEAYLGKDWPTDLGIAYLVVGLIVGTIICWDNDFGGNAGLKGKAIGMLACVWPLALIYQGFWWLWAKIFGAASD